MSAPDCVFCKIVSGDFPATKVLETPAAIAFLDIAPLAPGHTLLVPKTHVADVTQIPPEELSHLLDALPRLARSIQRVTGATGLNILQNNGRSAGQLVFHLHFHLIPRREGDGLGYRWNAGQYSAGEAAELQRNLVEQLKSA